MTMDSPLWWDLAHYRRAAVTSLTRGAGAAGRVVPRIDRMAAREAPATPVRARQ